MIPNSILHLAQDKQLHSDIYTDPTVFEQEMKELFYKAWVYVGHESQVPNVGDYLSTRIGKSPVLMVRDRDQRIHVLMNRCAHKGARLVSDTAGNLGKMVRCPYHAWTY